ncbi:neprilysin-2-like [Sitodiplosis mosellana]|uniref:neprilysin-2-like n=1 Tax=Sitodiplosis mosellana TaxID=263140 RepID=UPI0024450CE3|nr:neprilysin-2-like [Sitodiplosis mosellana]XP_055304831.1 neprilysin-2-like [Sitodiplosis mosellana]XP_055304833.1 neprilysin-2-like [Sitodiplosis mosellana]XP_055304834.1 neprilysin-2-like [Sitodiplosis mosellana]XP_055304835.1 neprilysin-2-like [Sitodiplosis mosellana]
MQSFSVVFSVVLLLWCVNANSLPNTTSGGPDICETETCAREASAMLNSLDESIHPCDNFYDFACGNFLRNTILPKNKTIIMSFTQVQDKVEEQLRTILTEDPYLNESKPFTLAKTFMRACLNEMALNEMGVTPLVETLETFGGWPVVKGDEWHGENWDWIDANRKMSDAGLIDSMILKTAIATDSKNSLKRVISIDQPSFGLSQKFLLHDLEDSNVKAYYEFMVDSAVVFGANKSVAEMELLDSLKFEMELAKIASTSEERRNQTALYNPFTISQLQTKYPFINWLDYINWNLHDLLKVNQNEVVIVLDTKYVSQLDHILKTTPKRTIANFFAWRAVIFASDYLDNVLHQKLDQYLAKTTGMQQADTREAECIKQTMNSLSISVGASYIRKYFNEESKIAATKIVKTIYEQFIKTLQTVEWMDGDTRKEAIQKAHKMNYHIAYPEELVDNNKLEEYYQHLELVSNSLYDNVRRVRIFKSNNLIRKLRLPVNKTDWETHSIPFIVNAFYSLLENSIQLPAAVLQDHFFKIDRPSYMNYATIGWFIGHEITHGFDDEGRQFDSNGNLMDWWKHDTANRFAAKANCIVDQYSNYTDSVSGLKVNGVNTQGENIADNGGVKGIYEAYQTFVNLNGPDPLLPGLHYTQNQLFWISAAQLWCAVTRPEFDTIQYTTDFHAPNKFRIIGTFTNMERFSHDFNCPKGTNMNPVYKCEVW